jgi:hypothetical protein
MKHYLASCLLFVLIAGCSWTPLRDNTTDPHSPFYIQGNRPPNIDSLRMITDCYQRDQGDFCAFEVHAWISDPDHNILFDSIMAGVITVGGDTVSLGRMTFNPDINGFSVRILQSEIPTGTLAQFVGDPILVTVWDDSGAFDTSSVEFHDLDKTWPRIKYPEGTDIPEVLNTNHPRLGWWPWGDCTVDHHSFSVSVVQEHLNTVWDTSGLALLPSTCWDDTFVVVGDSLSEGDGTPPGTFYSWYLTVTTRRGDRITGTPGNFYINTDALGQIPPEAMRWEDTPE